MSLFESDFSFADCVSNLCKNYFAELGDLRYIRQYVMVDGAFLAANALVSSQLDYCNSLLRSMPNFNKPKSLLKYRDKHYKSPGIELHATVLPLFHVLNINAVKFKIANFYLLCLNFTVVSSIFCTVNYLPNTDGPLGDDLILSYDLLICALRFG